ncbi:DNA repair protein RAD51 homolog 4 [Chrysoperla carnea]|uniref:DNA repair protein RAD51 homolog 4 n=1 Tax=Chrysoperla carnea TaxID=189513 RepID=UPI001D093933|nr:DNA repair protein RAD51 homolog 4 [Chrysoperla carnea]
MVENVQDEHKIKLTTEIHPLLTNDILTQLKNNDIRTLGNFLDKSIEELARKSKLKYKEISLIRKHIINTYTTNIFNAEEYYNKPLSSIIPTGIQSLDKLLEGGLRRGKVYEICGTPHSGKSQIFYTLAVNLSLERNQGIYFIDTRNEFCIERIEQILKLRGYNLEETAPKIENNIFVEQIFDVNDLITTLKELHDEIPKKWNHMRVIVIDLFSSIFWPLSFEESRLGFLNYVTNLINSLAKQHSIVVIIINSVKVNIVNKSVTTPDLGQYWFDVPDTRLLIKQNMFNVDNYSIEVLKSTRLKQGCIVNIVIDKNGVS